MEWDVTGEYFTYARTANLTKDNSLLKSMSPSINPLKVTVVSLIGFICSSSSHWSYLTGPGWYEFVSFSAFIISLILLIFYVLQIVAMGRPLSNLPWYLIEFLFCAIWAFFFLTASLVLAIRYGSFSGALAAAAFFGFVAMILYAYDAFLKMKMWKAGEIPSAISSRSGPTTTSSITMTA